MERELGEKNYYDRVNIQFLIVLWLHAPFVLITAYLSGTSLLFGLLASLAILSLPSYLVIWKRRSVEASISLAVGLVSFSALLIHCANGMTEMHFHIFSSLGCIIILAQPIASIAALAVVAIHHVAFYFFIPSSLINYKAGLHILVIHALFAVATGIPAAFIARRFRAYVVSVVEIVREVELISKVINDSTSSVEDASNSLAASSEQESSALVETSRSVVSLSELARLNSNRSGEARDRSAVASERSKEGSAAIHEVVHSVKDIQKISKDLSDAVAASNQGLSEISKVIQEIGGRVDVINDIVFQTKLLSFNASIEAARAGEHGKGFAVVALEVGNLAAQSGKSAIDINEMIAKSVASVNEVIEKTKKQMNGLVHETDTRVVKCLSLSDDCGNLLKLIRTETEGLAESARSISQSSNEQEEGINEISKATSSLEVSSVQNAGLAQTTSSAAKDLKKASTELTSAIQTLKVAIG